MIKEVTNITELEFNKEFFSRKPVVLKHAINGTNCFDTWSFDYLKARVGSRSVPVRHIGNAVFDQRSELIQMNFDELIDVLTSGRPDACSYYLQAAPIQSVFPELTDTIAKPSFIRDSDQSSSPMLWVGAAGGVSPLHYDPDENFLVQVRGTKLVTLFPPSDTPYLYANPEPPVHLSAIGQIDNVDPAAFPLFQQASPAEYTIRDGDIMYIPPRWWHTVKIIETSISINFWFKRPDIR